MNPSPLTLSLSQVLCAWDIYEYALIQTITIKFPFCQRLTEFGPKPMSLLPSGQHLVILCNEYIAKIKLGLVDGNQSESSGVFTSHKHPLCAAIYNKHLRQVREYALQ